MPMIMLQEQPVFAERQDPRPRPVFTGLQRDSDLIVTAPLDRDGEILSGEGMARIILGEFRSSLETLTTKLPDILEKKGRCTSISRRRRSSSQFATCCDYYEPQDQQNLTAHQINF